MLLASAILVVCFYTILGIKKPAAAVITLPFVSGLLLWTYGPYDNVEAILAILFIFPVTFIAILFSKHEPDADTWPRIVVKWLLGIILSAAFLFSLAVLFGPLSFYAIIVFFAFIGMVLSYLLTARHSSNVYIISTIGASMRQNLPLAMALGTAAEGRKDKQSQTLRRIQKWLVQGYSLSDAIKRGFPKCSGAAVAMISAAEKIGQVPYAIRAIEEDMIAKADEKKRIKPFQPLYVVVVLSFMFLIMLALMTFVIPKFHEVLNEMFEGAQLPLATKILLNITDLILYKMGFIFWPIVAIIFLVVVPYSIWVRFRPRKPFKPYLISRIGDWVKWHLPVLRWFEQNYSTVQVVEFMRLSLNTGSSINQAIRNTLELDINGCFRKRVAEWLGKIETGENISAAANQCGLGGTLVWAFDEKVNQGNTLQILEMLESFYRSNYNYRINLIRHIMGPCSTIMMGLMVGFVVFAIFSPGIAIISRLANMVTP